MAPLLTLAAVVEVVVTAELATFDHEGVVIELLVCKVIVAADFEVPDMKVLSK